MSVPLGSDASGHGPSPTEHQLEMARIRASTTGESLSHVLSVFMGVGRHGSEADEAATGPEAPLTSASDVQGLHGQPGGGDVPPRLAPVIPLSRAFRGKGADGSRTQEA